MVVEMSTVLWIVGGLTLFVVAALFSVGRPKRSVRAAAAHAPLLHSERRELEELRRMRAAALKSGKSE